MALNERGRWECEVCGYVYDEQQEGVAWAALAEDWECPACGAAKGQFAPLVSAASAPAVEAPDPGDYLREWQRSGDEVETYLADIHRMALTGEPIIEPMRARHAMVTWDDILVRGAQLARQPLNADEPVSLRTVIGPRAQRPMELALPVYVTHMSFGALSREAQTAMARGTAVARTAIGSGEGGVLPDALAAAHRYIFEYVPNRYSVTEEYLQRVDAVEIKIGQSAKPGLGGHLPGAKVTPEIAAVRGKPAGQDIHSPARFADLRTPADLRALVTWLRQATGGKPIGVKLAAGHIEADLAFALAAAPDFVTIDGRAGGTGAAPKFIKMATSVPTIYALYRARRALDAHGAEGVSLVITGGLRVSPDFAKALAMGADAVAIGTAAMIACGCQQYRLCHTGRCPVGVATQDAALRARLDVDASATRVANYLRAVAQELADFARLTGHAEVHELSVADLCTTSSEIAGHTSIEHA